MEITISVDEETGAAARRAVAAMGKSLEEVLCEYVHQLAKREAALQEMLSTDGQGNSSGWRFDRDELHERR